MAVSSNSQDPQANPKSEEEVTPSNCDLPNPCTSSKATNKEDAKDSNNTNTIAQVEVENNDSNVSEVMQGANNNSTILQEHSDHSMSNSIQTNDVDLTTSPQNTVGLPCSENRTDLGSVIHSENDRNTSSHAPPALPPRPANLQLPQVNGVPHPPHAFNASHGKD